MVLCHIQDICWGVLPLGSRCILHPPTDWADGFRLVLVDKFTKIVESAFEPFLDHRKRLFSYVTIFKKLLGFFITLQKLSKQIVELNVDAHNINWI